MRTLIAILMLLSSGMVAQETNVRWEYCVAESQLPNLNTDGFYEGKVRICHATAQGCREELVTLSDQVRYERYDQYAAAAVDQRAVAKALALLGKDGWELVSVELRSRDDFRGQSRLLYFKRRAR